MVWKLDRLGRNMLHNLQTVKELTDRDGWIKTRDFTPRGWVHARRIVAQPVRRGDAGCSRRPRPVSSVGGTRNRRRPRVPDGPPMASLRTGGVDCEGLQSTGGLFCDLTLDVHGLPVLRRLLITREGDAFLTGPYPDHG